MIIVRELMNHDYTTVVRELLSIGFGIQEIATLTQMSFALVKETIKDNALKERDDLADDPVEHVKQIMLAALAVRQTTSQGETRKAIDRYLCIDGLGKKTIIEVARALQDLCNPPVTPDTKAEIDFLISVLDTPQKTINPVHEARKLFDLLRTGQRVLKSGIPIVEIRIFLVEQCRSQIIPHFDDDTIHEIVNDLLLPGLTVFETTLLRRFYGMGFEKKSLAMIAEKLQEPVSEIKKFFNRAIAKVKRKARAKKVQRMFWPTQALIGRIQYLEAQLELYADNRDRYQQPAMFVDPLPDTVAQLMLSGSELKKEGLTLSDAMIEKLKKLGIETVDDVYRINIEYDPRLHQTEGIGAKTRRKLQEVQDWAKHHAKLKYPTE